MKAWKVAEDVRKIISKFNSRLTDETPAAHHRWQNVLEAISLGEELDGELGCKEADKLDGSSLLILAFLLLEFIP